MYTEKHACVCLHCKRYALAIFAVFQSFQILITDFQLVLPKYNVYNIYCSIFLIHSTLMTDEL